MRYVGILKLSENQIVITDSTSSEITNQLQNFQNIGLSESYKNSQYSK